jgi:hypothetical protein
MRNVGFGIGITAMLLGVIMLAFGNGFGLIVLMAGTLGAIANK